MSVRLTLLCVVSMCLCATAGLEAQEPPRFAGPTREGFVLPNGWVISPVGHQVAIKDLPLNILPLPDGRHALVATSGYNAHELSLVDLEKTGGGGSPDSPAKAGLVWRPRRTSIGSGGPEAGRTSTIGSRSRAQS